MGALISFFTCHFFLSHRGNTSSTQEDLLLVAAASECPRNKQRRTYVHNTSKAEEVHPHLHDRALLVTKTSAAGLSAQHNEQCTTLRIERTWTNAKQPPIILMWPAAIAARTLASMRALQLVGEVDLLPFQTWPLDDLTTDVTSILDSCQLTGVWDGLETASTAISDSDPSDALPLAMDGYAYMQRIAKNSCSDAERTTFETTLQDFETCAGLDLLAFMEEFPSALVGAWLECLLSFLAEYDPLTTTSMQPWDRVPDSCVKALYGSHSLGNVLRQLTLYPDQVRPCFAILSTNLPNCRYDTWPIPIIGDWVKKVSCVLGSTQMLHQDICEVELRNFLKCIPETVNDDHNTCSASVDSCARESIYLSLPQPWRGAPLADTCQRVAEERKLSSAVLRYKEFQNQCTSEWKGWHPTTDAASASFLGTSDNPMAGNISNAGVNVIIFLGGVTVGVLLVAVMVIVRSRRKVYTQVSSSETEMIASASTSGERNVI